METKNLLMKTAAAEGGVTQNDAQVTYLHSNDREAPNKIQCFSLEGTAWSSLADGTSYEASISIII